MSHHRRARQTTPQANRQESTSSFCNTFSGFLIFYLVPMTHRPILYPPNQAPPSSSGYECVPSNTLDSSRYNHAMKRCPAQNGLHMYGELGTVLQ